MALPTSESDVGVASRQKCSKRNHESCPLLERDVSSQDSNLDSHGSYGRKVPAKIGKASSHCFVLLRILPRMTQAMRKIGRHKEPRLSRWERWDY